MGANENPNSGKPSTARVLRFLIGLFVLGLLMGLRSELHSRWARLLLAAAAFAVLVVCMLPIRKPRQ